MKALTLHQPWATLVAWGAKQYETRSWGTAYRGPLAIHAGKNIDALEELAAYYYREQETGVPLAEKLSSFSPSSSLALAHYFREVLRARQLVPFKLRGLPLGAIVAMVDLIDIVRVVDPIGDQELAFGNFADGRFFWKLANVRMLEHPIPARGYQQLWDVSPDLEQRILLELNNEAVK